MAKSKQSRGQGQDKTLTKKQIARGRKVERQQRVVWLSVASVAALILIVLAVGIVQEYVMAPRRAVATVNGEKITKQEYQKRVRYDLWYLQRIAQNLALQRASYDPNDQSQQFLVQYIDSQLQQVEAELGNVPTQSLEDLINEALVRQEAERRGLTVSSQNVQMSIEQQMGYERNPPEPTPTPITATTSLTPTTPADPMTKEEFDTAYSEFIAALESGVEGFSEQDMLYAFEQGLLRQQLSDAIADQVPTTDEHVHAYHILVEDEDTATLVLEKLKAGGDFAALVAEYSQDESSLEADGELGWLAADQTVVAASVVEAAFALQPGEYSEPVESYQGYHIVTIDERQMDRVLDEATLRARQAQAFSDWLTQAQETADIERSLTPEDIPSS